LLQPYSKGFLTYMFLRHSLLVRQMVLLPLLLVSFTLFSQKCEVEPEALKGTYTGGCKKGKAQGKGKAIGTDTYEGEFKKGWPEGKGTYTWMNGNTYTGSFVKGMPDGEGIMKYKRAGQADSVVEGYWKKGVYAGKYESPYKIFFKSKSITEVEVEYKKEFYNEITFFVSNTSGGAQNYSGSLPKMKVDDIQMQSGALGQITHNANHARKTETTLRNVVLPARMKVIMGSEELEIEFREPGIYVVNIRINL
jgi:hypothetical protein